MIKKVKCACCGKKRIILILFHKIISRWWYFGTVKHLLNHEDVEYWECPKCKRLEYDY